MDESQRRSRFQDAFGRVISANLARQGMTQEALASATGLSERSYLNKVITGRKQPPDGWIDTVSDVLDMPPEDREALKQAAEERKRAPLDLTRK